MAGILSIITQRTLDVYYFRVTWANCPHPRCLLLVLFACYLPFRTQIMESASTANSKVAQTPYQPNHHLILDWKMPQPPNYTFSMFLLRKCSSSVHLEENCSFKADQWDLDGLTDKIDNSRPTFSSISDSIRLLQRTIFSLTNNSRLQIDHDSSGDEATISCLWEESGEGLVLILWWHQAVGLDSVLQTVQLPAGISDLDTGLPDMDRDHFTLKLVFQTSMTSGL